MFDEIVIGCSLAPARPARMPSWLSSFSPIWASVRPINARSGSRRMEPAKVSRDPKAPIWIVAAACFDSASARWVGSEAATEKPSAVPVWLRSISSRPRPARKRTRPRTDSKTRSSPLGPARERDRRASSTEIRKRLNRVDWPKSPIAWSSNSVTLRGEWNRASRAPTSTRISGLIRPSAGPSIEPSIRSMRSNWMIACGARSSPSPAIRRTETSS